ncbi:MAG: maleate cis-trans isomerase family protein [Hyphomicrobiales bacterium]
MTDSLGYRLKLAVIAPSTNTSVQPEMDDMRPEGVTNHFGRIFIPDDPIRNDADFEQLLVNIRASMEITIEQVITCDPDRLVMGMSSETFWDGVEGARELERRMSEVAGGRPVSMGSDAVNDALKCYGDVRRIAVVTPYMPVADRQVQRYFEDCGFEVVALEGLKCSSPVQIAHTSERALRDAMLKVDDPSVEAIVQVGTNLAAARLAGVAEFWLDKPVIAINTAIYWHALRASGVDDKIQGFGSLLADH